MNGKMQPLNRVPDPSGNIVLTKNYRVTDRGVLPECRVLKRDELAQGDLFAEEVERYMPHHATCPHADQLRNRRAS